MFEELFKFQVLKNIAFLEKEIKESKERINSSGFSKYDTVGKIVYSYRTELKSLLFKAYSDLKNIEENEKGLK